MADEKKKSKNIVKDVSFKVVKATVKAILIYLIYFLLTSMLAPLFGLIPGFMESIEAFVAVYITLMILSEITERTIFQYFFSATRTLLFVAYLLLSMGNGVINASYENFLNLTLFYMIALTLSLIGFARSILQAINFMSERTEATSGLQPPQQA